MPKENNKMQVDIDNLFKQNVNDLTSIKELYRKLEEIEKKITQIKYIDSNLANKLKKEYEKLKKIILDENVQAELNNKIEETKTEINEKIEETKTEINEKIEETKTEINEVSSQMDNNVRELTSKINEVASTGTTTEIIQNKVSEMAQSGKIVFNTVRPDMTTFLTIDTTNSALNLFNGIFINGGVTGSAAPYKYKVDDTGSKKIAILNIEPNTTYSIIRTETTGKFFKVFTHSSTIISDGDTIDGSIVFNGGGKLNYTFTSGENDVLLLVYVTYTGEEPPFLQIVKGTQTSFTTNDYATYIPKKNISIYNKSEVYSKNEVNTLLSSLIDNRQILCKKSGTEINIYVPCKKSLNYMRYQYILDNRPTINMNQWRILITEIVDKDLNTVFNIGTDTEWEGVVKEKGTADFIGGFHGDETNVMLSVFIDGVEMNINDSWDLTVKTEIKIVNKSIINRCNTPNDNLFTRYKISTWNMDNYIVENRWIALQTVTLDKSYLTMLSLPITVAGYNIGQYSRSNDGYVIQPSVGVEVENGNLTPSFYATIYEAWGDSGFYGKCETIQDYRHFTTLPKGWLRNDRSQTNKIKAYFNYLATNDVVNQGQELIAKSIFTFIY